MMAGDLRLPGTLPDHLLGRRGILVSFPSVGHKNQQNFQE
jgi:hypothetical protein